MEYQQELSGRPIAIIVLKASSNRIADTRPLMSKVLKELSDLKRGGVTTIS